jgi:hypothetical protein
MEYLISWKGYESDDNTWQAIEDLQGCIETVEMYHKEHPDKIDKIQKVIL